VIVTAVLVATGLVVVVKVAVVAPASTITESGTWPADALLEVKLTIAPPKGAGAFRVTVPVDDTPPGTDVGLTLTLLSADGVTVKVVVRLTPLYKPVIVTAVWDATGLVVAVNVAVVTPARTITEAGTCAAAVLLEVKLTIAPPVGAGALSVTVPGDDVPPRTVAGLTLNPLSAATAAVTVKVAVRLTVL